MDLMNRRRIMLAQKPLPYDAEVEYLESNGTQYIDTGLKFNTGTDTVEVEFMITQGSSGTEGIFGSRANASSFNFSVLKSSSNSIVVDINNGDYSTYRLNSMQDASGKICTVHMERDYKAIIYDGVLIASSNTVSQTFTTHSNALILAVGNINKVSARLYSLQCIRNNNTLLDLIPVRIGTVGYMYDRVNGTLFGNAGSGSFILGNDVN